MPYAGGNGIGDAFDDCGDEVVNDGRRPRRRRMLGLSHPNRVSVYQHRYDDMPQPVIDLGRGRVKLWLRPEIEQWRAQQATTGRSRRRTDRR